MKIKSQLIAIIALMALSLWGISGCARSGGIVNIPASTTENSGAQVENGSTPIQTQETITPAGDFVFTGEGDAELAAKTNALMLAIKDKDTNALTDMLKHYSKPEDYYGGVVNALTDPGEYAYTFVSWTVDEARWYEERGFGVAWGEYTIERGETSGYYVIFQYATEGEVSERVITRMNFWSDR